jgi:hypothetical protein
MTKIDTFGLRRAIPAEEFDYNLLCGALSSYSAPRQKIHDLLAAGVIVRIKKGLYVFGPRYNLAPVCKEVLANLIYGPSYISLEYALAYHGLIPEGVQELTSVTPKRDKEYVTPLGRFSYRYIRGEIYSLQIEQIWLDAKHPVLMATPEKALCDYLALRRIPAWEAPENARDFLESDLRIDREHLRLDKDVIRQLNLSYRNPNIDRILEAL